MTVVLASCSIATTAQVLHKDPAKVTPQDRVALYFAGLALVQPSSGGGFPSDEWFEALGRCEQPGSGYAGVQWDTHGPIYEGGLGFWTGTWDQYAPQVLTNPPDNAGDAPWWDQIRVARYLYSLYGPSPWGCAPVAGPAF